MFTTKAGVVVKLKGVRSMINCSYTPTHPFFSLHIQPENLPRRDGLTLMRATRVDSTPVRFLNNRPTTYPVNVCQAVRIATPQHCLALAPRRPQTVALMNDGQVANRPHSDFNAMRSSLLGSRLSAHSIKDAPLISLLGMSLCFIASHWALHLNEVSREEFTANVVAHFAGSRHTIRVTPNSDPAICPDASYNPFASSVRKVALETEYEPVTDAQPYEQLLLDRFNGNYDEVESALTNLHQNTANPDLVQPVAVLAALEGHGKILKLSLDRGAVIDRHLARAIEKGQRKSPEMAEVTAPYKAQIEEMSRGRKGPDGNFTDEQLEEWYGDIEW